jgi:hypothetical protein
MSAQPFTIQIADDVLSDLQQRLQRTRWPDEIADAGWDYGTNLDYLKQHEIVMPVRSIAEGTYNIQRWSVMQAGGHFAALEQPEALVHEIRAFFKPLRQ